MKRLFGALMLCGFLVTSVAQAAQPKPAVHSKVGHKAAHKQAKAKKNAKGRKAAHKAQSHKK
jgi:hypothetical protein